MSKKTAIYIFYIHCFFLGYVTSQGDWLLLILYSIWFFFVLFLMHLIATNPTAALYYNKFTSFLTLCYNKFISFLILFISYLTLYFSIFISYFEKKYKRLKERLKYYKQKNKSSKP